MQTATTTINKFVRIGRGPDGDVYAQIQYEGTRLSITGVVGPTTKGDAASCGQIIGSTWEIREYAPGWDADLEARFRQTWKAWHLNDMRPGCEHQRAPADGREPWSERRIDTSKPKDRYGLHFVGQRTASWNMLGWVRRDEHPLGLLGEPCPTCGYKYGTAWLSEDVPAEVIEFLMSLPSASAPKGW